jgi:ParB/RepB/Spo0J family partition protein
MSKKHDAIFDDVLSGLDGPTATPERANARFLKRSTSIGERMSGEMQEKTLYQVDPARCRMWARHNRDYALLTEDNCRDLIDGIKAQGQQEFPAIVRRVTGEEHEFEVICGARRHFAVSWLRANNYPQFRYLIEVRDLTDEEAFRLADIENRDREDISDYERAVDYAEAIRLYYDGSQKAMAERLEVTSCAGPEAAFECARSGQFGIGGSSFHYGCADAGGEGAGWICRSGRRVQAPKSSGKPQAENGKSQDRYSVSPLAGRGRYYGQKAR